MPSSITGIFLCVLTGTILIFMVLMIQWNLAYENVDVCRSVPFPWDFNSPLTYLYLWVCKCFCICVCVAVLTFTYLRSKPSSHFPERCHIPLTVQARSEEFLIELNQPGAFKGSRMQLPKLKFGQDMGASDSTLPENTRNLVLCPIWKLMPTVKKCLAFTHC